MSPRIESGLRQTARLFDDISDVVIDNRVYGKEPDVKERERAELMRQYPRRQTGANMATILDHLMDPAVGAFWRAEASVAWGDQNQVKLHRQAVAALRDEAVDIYISLQDELEQIDISLLNNAFDCIRWKLKALEPVFAHTVYNPHISVRDLPARQTPKAADYEHPLEVGNTRFTDTRSR